METPWKIETLKLKKLLSNWIFSGKLNRNNFTSSDHKMTKNGLLDSPRWGASNGGYIKLLKSISNEIPPKVYKQLNANNFPSSSAREMKPPPFDASPYCESNKLCFVVPWQVGIKPSWKTETSKLEKLLKLYFTEKLISRWLLTLEAQYCRHLIRLVMTNPISCVSFFCDHWVKSYCDLILL